MKSLYKNNANPLRGQRPAFDFWVLHKLLIDEGNGIASTYAKVGVGNNTTASFALVGHNDPQAIVVRYYDTDLAMIYDDDSVILLDPGPHYTKATKVRMDWCIFALGFRLTSIRRTWKIYSIDTGAYRDFHAGMVIRKGAF